MQAKFCAMPSGNTLPRRSNTVFGMGERKRLLEVLAENVRGLRERPDAPKGLGASPKTINNIEKARHNVQLDTLESIAKKLKVEPYQLLIPTDDEKFLDVILAWAQSDERGRGDLHAIAEALLRRHGGQDDRGASTAALHRQRNRTG